MGLSAVSGRGQVLGGVKNTVAAVRISNQMLAAVALVLSTVVLIKMQRTKYIWVTVIYGGMAADLHHGRWA